MKKLLLSISALIVFAFYSLFKGGKTSGVATSGSASDIGSMSSTQDIVITPSVGDSGSAGKSSQGNYKYGRYL